MEHETKTKMISFSAILIPLLVGLLIILSLYQKKNNKIKLGIIYSKIGPMAAIEQPIVNSVLLSIKQINKTGGLLGKQIDPIVAACSPTAESFAAKADFLIKNENVCAIFGCYTSATRRAIKSIVEKHKNLLIFPAAYEGLETSENVLYVGTTANQQITPAITWCIKTLGKKLFLVGSNNLFSKISHIIIKEHAKFFGAQILEDSYIIQKTNNPEINNNQTQDFSKNIKQIIELIKNKNPEVIINTLQWDENKEFMLQLKSEGITRDKIPTMFFRLDKAKIKNIGTDILSGNYTSSSYFENIQTKENLKFIRKIKKEYGPNKSITADEASGYASIQLWAKAIKKAGSANPTSVKKALENIDIKSPEGTIYVDPKTMHTYKQIRIGKIASDGQINTIWDSEKPIPPQPYPPYKSVSEWNKVAGEIYKEWEN
jgi:urea transport system substrate-binding protein